MRSEKMSTVAEKMVSPKQARNTVDCCHLLRRSFTLSNAEAVLLNLGSIFVCCCLSFFAIKSGILVFEKVLSYHSMFLFSSFWSDRSFSHTLW